MPPNAVYLTEQEAISFQDVIPEHVLARHCPLDSGAHSLDCDSAPDLGHLQCLPIELQQQVLHIQPLCEEPVGCKEGEQAGYATCGEPSRLEEGEHLSRNCGVRITLTSPGHDTRIQYHTPRNWFAYTRHFHPAATLLRS